MVDFPGFTGLSFNSEYWGHGFTRRKLRALWAAVTFLSVGGLLPFTIYLFSRDHTSARQVILVLGSIFTFLAVPNTLYGIWQHISSYTQPLLQRYIIRILWMVPIYALDSWVALVLTRNCLAKYSYIPDTLRQAYEAYTIYNFFCYLTTYMEGASGVSAGQMLESKHHARAAGGEGKGFAGEYLVSHLPPFHFKYKDFELTLLDPWEAGDSFVQKCKFGVLSYVVYMPIYSIASISYESMHPGQLQNDMFDFSSLYFYVSLGQSLISMWAIYCMVLFYHEAKQELRPINPLYKFLSIKGIVFATFWQGIALQFFSSLWEGDNHSIYDKKHGLWNCPYSKFHVTKALNDFLVCIEMFVLSFAFAFSFPSSEFRVPIDATHLAGAGDDGYTAEVLSRSAVGPKLRALFDVHDVTQDVRDHTGRLYGEAAGTVTYGGMSAFKYTRRFLSRLFGYDNNSSYQYLLATGQAGLKNRPEGYGSLSDLPASPYGGA